MSKPPPVSRSARLQVLAVILMAVAFMAFVNWLHVSAPQVAQPTHLELAQETPEDEIISCERTLPEVDVEALEDEQVQGPVGRVSSTEVNQCPRRFDGRLVTYIGEVVGDVLQRDGGAWVQINDDAYGLVAGPLPSHRNFSGTNSGLAVWLPQHTFETVHTPGRRGIRGDIVRVVGTLHRADPNDGGGLTIRAREIAVLSPSVNVDQPLHVAQAITAAALGLLSLALIVLGRQSSSKR